MYCLKLFTALCNTMAQANVPLGDNKVNLILSANSVSYFCQCGPSCSPCRTPLRSHLSLGPRAHCDLGHVGLKPKCQKDHNSQIPHRFCSSYSIVHVFHFHTGRYVRVLSAVCSVWDGELDTLLLWLDDIWASSNDREGEGLSHTRSYKTKTKYD